MIKYTLSSAECTALHLYATRLINKFGTVEQANSHENHFNLIEKLTSLAKILWEFKHDYDRNNIDSTFLLNGLTISDNKLGVTPASWEERENNNYVHHIEACFYLIATMLAEPFSWSTQQNGHIIQEIVPKKTFEKKQLSSGSKVDLYYHTEEALHDARADYIVLLCLRNPEQAQTTFSYLTKQDTQRLNFSELSKPQYDILPDEGHEKLSSELNWRYENKHKISVLSGDKENPYLRIDPLFMPCNNLSPQALVAFNQVKLILETNMQSICLKPGSILIIDNLRAVHGRKRFTPLFNGYGRWLKRLNLNRDLRRAKANYAPFCF